MKIMRMSKKANSMISFLGAVVVTVGLLLIIVLALFSGKEGKLNFAMDKLKDLVKGVPEIDQTKNEMNFFRTNQAQIDTAVSWSKTMKNAVDGKVTDGGCFMQLASLEEDGFYAPGANYNLYLEQSGSDIKLSLTRFARQDFQGNSQKTETPVTTAKVEGATLCVIGGDANTGDLDAVVFYQTFNEILFGPDLADLKLVNPTPAPYILISSGKDENIDKRSIGYSFTTKPADIKDYKWAELFKRKDRTIIYAVRIDKGGQKYVCLLPTYDDWGSKCGKPKNGLMQIDCFDRDGGTNSIKYNFEHKKIPSYMMCNDKPVIVNNPAVNNPAAEGAAPILTDTGIQIKEPVENVPVEPLQQKATEIYEQNIKNKASVGDNSIVVLAGEGAEKLYLFKKTDTSQELVKTYSISSSKYGYGFTPGSDMTPTGLHQIAEAIFMDKGGNVAPMDTVFVSKISTDKLYSDGSFSADNEDLITSRILSLKGLEPENQNSFARSIYIHGTNHEDTIGTPSSHGCIRMTNTDVIDLFGAVRVNSYVYIYHYS